MLKLWWYHVHLLFLVCYRSTFFASAFLVNVTVDDQGADPTTGTSIAYSSGSWNIGQTCSVCTAHPSAGSALDGSWHDTTYDPSSGEPGAGQVTFTFTGSAVYLYGIIALDNSGALSVPYDLYLFIDGTQVGNLAQGQGLAVDGVQSQFQYNALLFAEDSLPNQQHTVVLRNGGGTSRSLLLFDYLEYTTNAKQTSSPVASPVTSNEVPSGPPTSITSAIPAGPPVSTTSPTNSAPAVSSASSASSPTSQIPSPSPLASTLPTSAPRSSSPGTASTPMPGTSSVSAPGTQGSDSVRISTVLVPASATGGAGSSSGLPNRATTSRTGLIVGVSAGVGGLLVIAVVALIRWRKRSAEGHTSTPQNPLVSKGRNATWEGSSGYHGSSGASAYSGSPLIRERYASGDSAQQASEPPSIPATPRTSSSLVSRGRSSYIVPDWPFSRRTAEASSVIDRSPSPPTSEINSSTALNFAGSHSDDVASAALPSLDRAPSVDSLRPPSYRSRQTPTPHSEPARGATPYWLDAEYVENLPVYEQGCSSCGRGADGHSSANVDGTP